MYKQNVVANNSHPLNSWYENDIEFNNEVKCLNCLPHKKKKVLDIQFYGLCKIKKNNFKSLFDNECSGVCALPPPYVLDEREKQIVYDYANVYCQYIELFSYFPADTTMHPVLKNLGITDKVISFIMGSVNGNKVKKQTCFGKVINGCVCWMNCQIKQTLYLSSMHPHSCTCPRLYVLVWVHELPADVEETHWGVHDRRMKWPVLIVSDRPWSAVIFAL